MKVSDLVWKFVSITYNYHLALQIAVQLTMVQISTESSQKYTNFGMWKTGSAKCFSQTLQKVPFRFRKQSHWLALIPQTSGPDA